MGQSKIDNPEKLATKVTQDEEKQNKNTTHYVLDTTQTNTNNVNKKWALVQTTGGKDEPKIVFMRKSWQTSQHGTKNLKTQNRFSYKLIFPYADVLPLCSIKRNIIKTLLQICIFS